MSGGDGRPWALEQTVAELASRVGGEGGIRMEIVEDEAFLPATAGDAWIRGADLAAGDVAALARLEAAARVHTGDTDRKTIGLAMAWQAGPLVSGPVAIVTSAARVPHIGAEDLAVALGDGCLAIRRSTFACLADDEAVATDPDARPVVDRAALRAETAALVERILGPLAEALHGATSIAPAAVWGMAAGTVAWELVEAPLTGAAAPGDDRPPSREAIEEAIAEADRILAAGPRLGRRRPNLFVVDSAAGPWFGMTGAACCRAYRWDGRTDLLCLTCPLRDEESRLAGYREWRESLAL